MNEASTTRNKWLTLEGWKTIIYHYYLDDELSFSMNRLKWAVKLFGSAVNSKMSGNQDHDTNNDVAVPTTATASTVVIEDQPSQSYANDHAASTTAAA